MINIKDVSKAVRDSAAHEMQARKVRLIFKSGNKVIQIAEFIDEDHILKSGQLSAFVRNAIKDVLEEATSFELENF